MFEPFSATAAIFDCDDSLILGNAGFVYFRYLIENGVMIKRQRGRALTMFTDLARGKIADEAAVAQGISLMGGIPVELAIECARTCYRESVSALVNRAGRERAAEHLATGHLVLVASGSPSYIVNELARDLRCHLALGSEPVVRNGQIQSEVPSEVCFGQGKRRRVLRTMETYRILLSRSYLYSDSAADLPLFKLVGHQIVVNPRPKFNEQAKQLGYAVERW